MEKKKKEKNRRRYGKGRGLWLEEEGMVYLSHKYICP